eukprot:m.128794 g.128794  ORF g.128794 m.128794 type:complete len:342 (+) comp15680_c0_seq2:164-1189(+)
MSRASDEDDDVPKPLDTALDAFLSDVHLHVIASDRSTTQVSRFVLYTEDIRGSTHSGAKQVVSISPSLKKAKGVAHAEQLAQYGVQHDPDGDVDPPRPQRLRPALVLRLRHRMETPVDDVGLQLWQGAFVLMDLLMSQGRSYLQGKHILELGAGLGAASIVAAYNGAHVLCTDIGDEVLHNCQENLSEHCSFFQGSARVRRLDWSHVNQLLSDSVIWPAQGSDNFAWSQDDVQELRNCTAIYAADVVYIEAWTEAFIACLLKLFEETAIDVCFLALEKRLNFSLEELDIACPAYTHFEAICLKSPRFTCQQIPLTSLPQHMLYHRIPQLELWEIRPNNNLS